MVETTTKCRGVNASILLSSDKMVIRSGLLGSPEPHQIPLSTVRAVVVDRKSVMPFATMTVLAGVVAVLAKYNALWFLINLNQAQIAWVSDVGFTAMLLCAIPLVLRALFVNVTVRSDADAAVLVVRLVSVRSAKRLAKRFRELS